MTQDNLIWIAVGVLGFLSVWLGTESGKKVQSSIGGFLKGLIPKRKPIDSTDSDVSVHEVVEHLLTLAEADKDDEGIMLLSAYGKHLYERREKEAQDGN
jgi:hypothetical protein